MNKEQIERRLKLIETEINLWRTPWQDRETPLEEKRLIFKRVIKLTEEERELQKKLREV
jgi:hypothetical protein